MGGRGGGRRTKDEEERLRKDVERYYGKIDLARSWADIDPEYSHRLHKEAGKLRDHLIIKGIFSL